MSQKPGPGDVKSNDTVAVAIAATAAHGEVPPASGREEGSQDVQDATLMQLDADGNPSDAAQPAARQATASPAQPMDIDADADAPAARSQDEKGKATADAGAAHASAEAAEPPATSTEAAVDARQADQAADAGAEAGAQDAAAAGDADADAEQEASKPALAKQTSRGKGKAKRNELDALLADNHAERHAVLESSRSLRARHSATAPDKPAAPKRKNQQGKKQQQQQRESEPDEQQEQQQQEEQQEAAQPARKRAKGKAAAAAPATEKQQEQQEEEEAADEQQPRPDSAEVARRSARERKGNAKYAAGAAAGGDEPEATAKGERGKRQLRPEAVEDSSDEEQQEEEEAQPPAKRRRAGAKDESEAAEAEAEAEAAAGSKGTAGKGSASKGAAKKGAAVRGAKAKQEAASEPEPEHPALPDESELQAMDFHELMHVFKASERAIKAHLDLLKALPQHISKQEVTVADLRDSEAGKCFMAFTRGLSTDVVQPYSTIVGKWKAAFQPAANNKQQPPAASKQEGQQQQQQGPGKQRQAKAGSTAKVKQEAGTPMSPPDPAAPAAPAPAQTPFANGNDSNTQQELAPGSSKPSTSKQQQQEQQQGQGPDQQHLFLGLIDLQPTGEDERDRALALLAACLSSSTPVDPFQAAQQLEQAVMDRCGAVGPSYRALVKQLYSVLAPAKGEAAAELLNMLLQGQLVPGQLVEECSKLQEQGA